MGLGGTVMVPVTHPLTSSLASLRTGFGGVADIGGAPLRYGALKVSCTCLRAGALDPLRTVAGCQSGHSASSQMTLET